MRLLGVAVEHFTMLDGFAVSRGVSFEELPLPRFLNFVYWWATRNAGEEEKTKFDRKLWQPPKGEVGQGIWSAESESAAFASLKNALGQ